MAFDFRQRIDLLPRDRLKAPEHRVSLPDPAGHLRLVAWQEATPIEQHHRMLLVGGPYSS